jgi:hypothetical protein
VDSNDNPNQNRNFNVSLKLNFKNKALNEFEDKDVNRKLIGNDNSSRNEVSGGLSPKTDREEEHPIGSLNSKGKLNFTIIVGEFYSFLG